MTKLTGGPGPIAVQLREQTGLITVQLRRGICDEVHRRTGINHRPIVQADRINHSTMTLQFLEVKLLVAMLARMP